MSFTYNASLSTDRDKVRLLATDVDAASPIFTDAEVDAFMSLEGSNIKRSAALALETIARNQVLVLKVIRLLEIQTDGASVARELRMQADKLREQADRDEAASDGGAFDWAEMVVDDFSLRNRFVSSALRGDV
jgi:hypothetical protein